MNDLIWGNDWTRSGRTRLPIRPNSKMIVKLYSLYAYIKPIVRHIWGQY